jgi:hypothetical protein
LEEETGVTVCEEVDEGVGYMNGLWKLSVTELRDIEVRVVYIPENLPQHLSGYQIEYHDPIPI